MNAGIFGFCFAGLLLATFPSVVSAEELPPSVLGNTLNPTGSGLTDRVDPRGMTLFKQRVSRSPAGILYDTPRVPSIIAPGGWTGTVDIGVLTNDGPEEATEFNEYTDWKRSALVAFDFFRLSEDGRGYTELSVGAVGRDDQYGSLEFGSYGSYVINVVHAKTPHVFSQDASAFFDGIGSEYLALPPGLVPGANSSDEIDLALTVSDRGTLSIERTLNGMSFKLTPNEDVTLFLDFTSERQQGERPFGGAFLPTFYAGSGSGGVVETIEPVDYLTHSLSLGLSAVVGSYWLNFSYNGSLFENKKDSLTWENPFTNRVGDPFTLERGRFALYPDNQSHNLKLDFARSLPRGQFTTTISWTSMTQDEDLLPPTINTGQPRPNLDLDDWNTLDALPRKRADAEVQNMLVQSSLNMVLAPRLTFRAKLRYQDEDIRTDYTAFNPSIQQIGYVAVDGGFGNRSFEPGVNSSPFQFRSIPFDRKTLEMTAAIDYRPWRKTNLGVEIAREEVDRENREVSSSDDDLIRLTLSSRRLSWATVNLSYEYSQRDGDDYDPYPYARFFTASLPGYQSPFGTTPPAFTLDAMRKFDVADREVAKLKARVRFLVRDDMDISVQLQREHTDFEADYGVDYNDRDTFSVDFNFQPSPTTNLYAFWSWFNRASEMANIRDTGFSPDLSAGGSTYPLDSAWRESTDERSYAYGFGLSLHLTRWQFSSNLSVSDSSTQMDYSFASSNALAAPGASGNPSGRFPDIEHRNLQWTTEIDWYLTSKLTLRFFHRLDAGELDDWHFDGLQERIGNQLYLGIDLDDYEVNTFGVSVRYTH
ncbi:MAG: MtrB/PioB family decaheme-associated outer membrane protein [Gammaproteobacteria bacterium]|nr:MtrB/PioB family decaheme-associated outer membrane protein [Gammaproteobacteria bacterium]